MKLNIRYFDYMLPVAAAVLLALPTSCDNKDEGLLSDNSPYIEFGTQELSVETRAADSDPTMRNEFKPGDSFGVFGYCVPLNVSTGQPDYTSGSSYWSVKMNNAVPDVFLNQRVTLTESGSWQYDWENTGSVPTTYNPKYWYAEGKDTENNENSAITNTKDYRYDFFAYTPYDANVFSWEKPLNATDKGASCVKVTIPQQNGNDDMDPDDTPDAMLAVIHNYNKAVNSKLSFTFSHVFTALGFEVNNFSNQDLKIHSVKLSGTFWKSLTVDFTDNHYTYHPTETYKGTFVLFDETRDGELTLEAPTGDKTVTSSPSPIGGKYLRLLSGGFDPATGKPSSSYNNYLGEDVAVEISYTFGGTSATFSTPRPGTFLPQSGTQYTAQLNFVGNAFVLQFIVDNGEIWEDGGSDGNGDITFE